MTEIKSCYRAEGCNQPKYCKGRAACATPVLIYTGSNHPDERMNWSLKDVVNKHVDALEDQYALWNRQ